MRQYTVKEVSDMLGKHEETIKRWIRLGKFPNSYRNSDKQGWRIPENDLSKIKNVVIEDSYTHIESKPIIDEVELIKLAYQAISLTTPTEEILSILSVVGIKRTLEILLIMQQSPTKVKNQDGFIRKAIRENWSPISTPIKLPKTQSKRLYELSQQDFERNANEIRTYASQNTPLYNWLEEK